MKSTRRQLSLRRRAHFRRHPKPLEDRPAGRVEAIAADFFAGKNRALENQGPQSRHRAKCGAARARRAAPHDGDIPHFRVLSPATVPLSKEKPDLNKKVHEVPHKPGVYLMRDRFGRVIYVGKARDLRKRVGSYFMPSKMAVADLKTRALLEAVWDFETHTVASEPESLLLEGKLIKEYRPRYNISFRDDKRFLVVKVDPTEEWPRFRLARFKKDDGARYFGPYAHAGALRQTLNFMRKKFGVLTFGRGSPTERELKSSTYQVPMRLSEINAETYRQRVAQAAEFLEGTRAR